MSAVTTHQTYITPADAQRLLDVTAIANETLYPEKLNREVSPALVSEYAQTMLDGKWVCDGKTIIIDSTGAVLNGQHRLLACIEADCQFETWVAQGVERTARYTIDSNTRTLEDILYMKGEQNDLQLLASTLTLLVSYEEGVSDPGFSATPSEMLDLLERHPEIRSHVELVYGFASWARRASIAALSYLGSFIDEKRSAEFMAGLEWCASPSGVSGQVLRKALKSLPHCEDPQMEFYQLVMGTAALEVFLWPDAPQKHHSGFFTGFSGLPYGETLPARPTSDGAILAVRCNA
jgi:hypothetical protein